MDPLALPPAGSAPVTETFPADKNFYDEFFKDITGWSDAELAVHKELDDDYPNGVFDVRPTPTPFAPHRCSSCGVGHARRSWG